MKKILIPILFLLSINLVSANLIISEVMYNPSTSQGSDSKLEWIEIYNNDSLENLSQYTLDGNSLNGNINNKEYLILARNLFGFESYYGNNDSVWDSLDGDYKVIEIPFSLTNSNDLIELKKGNYSEILNYSNTWGANGNGFTLQKINVNQNNDRENWNESSINGGTPGRFYGENSSNQVEVTLTVTSPDLIKNITIPDESSKDGYQIFPNPGKNKTFLLVVEVNENLTLVKAILKGEEFILNENNSYSTNLTMNYYDLAGNYTITIVATDFNNETSSEEITFEYLGFLSSKLNTTNLNFGEISKGSYSNELNITILNQGNVEIDLEISSTDLINSEEIIFAENIEVFNNSWSSLSNVPKNFNFSIAPSLGSKKGLTFRIKVPQVLNGEYSGNIEIIGIGK